MWAYIWWSIYVRTSNMAKLKAEHLPPITEALEGTEFSWEITREDDAPGLVRLVNCQNLWGDSVESLIIPPLRRAYRLASPWSISGLGDLTAGQPRHVAGWCSDPPVRPRPPALASLVFEIQPGRVKGMSQDGGWAVVKEPKEPQ